MTSHCTASVQIHEKDRLSGSALALINDSTLGLVNTEIGDHLLVDKPPQFVTSHSAFYPQWDGK